MRKDSLAFLRGLVETPSPSGFEQPVQRVVRSYARPFAHEITTDLHGNVIAGLNPKGSPRVMFAGHCDQIGMMVTFITDEGYIHFKPIGGIDAAVISGTPVTIHTAKGPLHGLIGRKAVHLLSPAERGKAQELSEMWIDIGAENKKAAQKLVEIGDPVTFELRLSDLQGDFVASPGFDDKVGSFVVIEALRLLAERKTPPKAAVFAVSTVQEEIGLRGARTSCFGIDPKVGIAVDVTHAGDYPGAEKKITGDISLGKGPVIERGPNINPVVSKMLLDVAKKKRIPYQIAGAPGATGTDANAIQISRAGVAAGLVSIPNRYMHTPVEVVHLRDLENAAKLLAEFTALVDDRVDFVPQ